jgi:hypothetical protein
VTERCPARVARDARPGGWSNRDTAAHNRWARAVKERDGWRCTFIDGFVRCPVTEGLQAHHLVPGSWRPEDGTTFCGPHHQLVDPHARAR